MNLAAAGHRHLWPLTAANSWCFTNNLVDKATADENFSGFNDYEDFMGLEGSLGQCSDLSGKQRVSQGMEFAQTVTMPIEPPPAKPAEAAPESGDNGARANDVPTPPPAPVEGSQAEAGPGERAAVRPAAKQPPPRMKNEASMRVSK